MLSEALFARVLSVFNRRGDLQDDNGEYVSPLLVNHFLSVLSGNDFANEVCMISENGATGVTAHHLHLLLPLRFPDRSKHKRDRLVQQTSWDKFEFKSAFLPTRLMRRVPTAR
jgi:hypothetical protein